MGLFCYIGGYMQIGQVALACLATCIANAVSDENKKTLLRCVNAPGCCLGLFYLAWAGIGLYMYSNQMTPECKDEPIAKVLFAWSLIPYCLIGLACCCIPCCICGLGFTAFSDIMQNEATGGSGGGHTSEQEANESEKLV